MKQLIKPIVPLFVANAAFAALSVSNSDFTDIDWWTAAGGTASAAVGVADTGAANQMENFLGTNWRSNPGDIPGRDGARSFLLGSDFSPDTGRDGFGSLSIFDNGQIYTYLGQADSTGTVTLQWNTALRADAALPVNDLSFQFQTSSTSDFTGLVDAGGAASYSSLNIVPTDTAWQTVQYTSASINAGDHVYFYWYALAGTPTQQTLIQDISIVPEPSAFALLAGLLGLFYAGNRRNRR